MDNRQPRNIFLFMDASQSHAKKIGDPEKPQDKIAMREKIVKVCLPPQAFSK
jgi:hypothetical protein